MLYQSAYIKQIKLDKIDSYTNQNQVPSTYFQIIHQQDSKSALKLLKDQIDAFMAYDIYSFKYQMETTKEIRNSYMAYHMKRKVQNNNKESSWNHILEYKLSFSDFIRTKLNYKIQPNEWNQTKTLCKLFLNNSCDQENSMNLLNHIAKQKISINILRDKEGLGKNEIEGLKIINITKFSDISRKIGTDLNTKDLSQRKDLDHSIIQDRIQFCTQIKEKVQEDIKKIVISTTQIHEKDIKFAEVKQEERCRKKLNEYSQEKNTETDQWNSKAQKVKDILRCSVICDSHEQASKFIQEMEKSNQLISSFKNGFSKEDFNKNEQNDIKIILKTPENIGVFDEFVEMQIIQRVNLEIKRLEHKIYDFTRESYDHLNRSKENCGNIKCIDNLKYKFDRNAAEKLSNSIFQSLESIKEILIRQFPYFQIDNLEKEDYFKQLESFKDIKSFNILQKQLKFLSPIKDSILEIKLNFDTNMIDDIIFDNPKQINILKLRQTGYDADIEKLRQIFENLNMKMPNKKLRNDSKVTAIQPSHNSIYLFAGDEMGIITRFNNKNLNDIQIQLGHQAQISQIYEHRQTERDQNEKEFIKNQLFSSSYDHTIKIWDTNFGYCIGTLSIHTKPINGFIISFDNLLQSQGQDKKIIQWDIKTLKSKKIITTDNASLKKSNYKNENQPIDLLITKNGEHIINLNSNESIIHRYESGVVREQNGVFKGHEQHVTCIKIDLSSNRLQSGSVDKSIRSWDIGTLGCIHVFEGHSSIICDIAISEVYIYSCSPDETVRVWDLKSGLGVDSFTDHTKDVVSLELSPDHSRLYSSSLDATIKVWDVAHLTCVGTFKGHTDHSGTLKLNQDGSEIFHFSHSEVVKWSTDVEDVKGIFKGHTNKIISIIICQNTQSIYSCSEDMTIRKWSLIDYKSRKCLKPHTARINGFVMAPDNEILFTQSEDNQVKLIEIDQENSSDEDFEVIIALANPGPVKGVMFEVNQQGNYMQCQLKQAIVKWQLSDPNPEVFISPKILFKIDAHNDKISQTIISMKYIYTCSEDQLIKMWDNKKGDFVRQYKGHTRDVNGIFYTKNEKYIYSQSKDHTIRKWNVLTDKKELVIKYLNEKESLSQNFGVIIAQLDLNEAVLQSMNSDKTLRSFNAITGEPLFIQHEKAQMMYFDYSNSQLQITNVMKSIDVVDLKTGKIVYNYNEKNQGNISSIKFYADQGIAYVGSDNFKIQALKMQV